ncbi:MAG TPA: DUF305 domain-containing protein [Gemmatimonadaceae bacterium]|nr:DUF305 domain-containing protein [Gemmatimonadaceae bacterium]
MTHTLQRVAAGFAIALAVSALPIEIAAAQTPMTGVEQARVDSIRRPYTEGDIEFMSGMIGHHSQAVKMAGWCTSGHGASKSLQIFCGRIAMAQTAEIGLMSTWLKDRNQPVPDPDPRGMKMKMGGREMFMMMPGMLSDEQMKQLDAARGVEFDRLFLTYMIQHHKGAITMVEKLENTPGADQDEIVFKFSNDVQADQSTEIDRMQMMLDALPPK